MLHEKPSAAQANSFEALLHVIDREIEPAMMRDMGQLKEKGKRLRRQRKPYISFFLGTTELALEVGSVREIGGPPAVTRLPNLPVWIRGITQIRGEVLSVVDFVQLFTLHRDRIQNRPKASLLFSYQDFRFCLIIDKIGGVIHIDAQRDHLDAYVAAGSDPLAALADFFLGVYSTDQRRVFILNSEKLGAAPLIRNWG